MRTTRILKRTLMGISGTIIVLMLFVDVALPILLKEHINRELRLVSGNFTASCESVSVSFFRGKYALHRVQMKRLNTLKETTFLKADRVELGFAGFFLPERMSNGKVVVYKPELDLQQINAFQENEPAVNQSLKLICRKLTGIALTEIVIINGSIHYTNLSADPSIKLAMKEINIVINGVGDGVEQDDDPMAARAEGTANIYGGNLHFVVHFDPLSMLPAFNMQARLENLDLSYLKDYFSYRGHSDINSGMFSMVAQAKGDEEDVSGFVKPILETIHLARLDASPFARIRNPFTRPFPQIAFHEDLDDKSNTIWSAVALTMRDAFFEAVMPVIRKINSTQKRPKPQSGAGRSRIKSLSS